MGLETATYISDLVSTNPVGSTDQASTGDDHLRLIKSAIKTTFPNVSGAVTSTHTELNKLAAANNTGAAVDEIGYKGAPFNSKAIDYTLILTDAAKWVEQVGASKTLTIPANSSVAFPPGTIIIMTCGNATGCSIAITSDTLTLAGTTTTGTRTLAQNGMATLLKTSTTTWLISGAGLS